MAKSRSPNYPQMDLGSALEAVQTVYKAEDRNKMSKEILAGHLGYSSLSGRALSKIGALRAYGIIEGSGDELRVSEDAIIALEAPKDNPDRAAALQSMATKPDVFNDIAANFDGAVSKENLRYWLTRRGFTSEAASKAADTYLATIEIVSEFGSGSDYGQTRKENNAIQSDQISEKSAATGFSAERDSSSQSSVRRAIFPLDEGDVELIFPANMSQEGYEELDEYLKVFLKKEKKRKERQDRTDSENKNNGEETD